MNQWDDDKRGNNIKKLKQIYEQQEIPAELPLIIQNVIKKVENEKQEVNKLNNVNNIKKSRWKGLVGIAAAVVIFIGAFGIGVNTNEAFAATMRDVPILSSLVKVFTAEEIHESDDVSTIDIKIPEIDGLKDKELQDKINKDVYKDVSKAVKETKEILAEYKEARLATGGTEEDYVPTELVVDYEVKCISEDTLSFKVWVAQDFSSAYYQEFYYNYDLKKSSKIALEDLLGKDYVSTANKQIVTEIAERSKNKDNQYWSASEGGFETIRPDQAFYVNANGNPVIIFDKYEIAAGYMGMQEFEIKKNLE